MSHATYTAEDYIRKIWAELYPEITGPEHQLTIVQMVTLMRGEIRQLREIERRFIDLNRCVRMEEDLVG
jgi:hypothetical protein